MRPARRKAKAVGPREAEDNHLLFEDSHVDSTARADTDVDPAADEKVGDVGITTAVAALQAACIAQPSDEDATILAAAASESASIPAVCAPDSRPDLSTAVLAMAPVESRQAEVGRQGS